MPGSYSVRGFEAPLQALAHALGGPAMRSFNPSVFTHANQRVVVFRMANNTL
jgi:hypothetical protein